MGLSENSTRHIMVLGTPAVMIVGGLVAFKIDGYPLTFTVLGSMTVALSIVAYFFRSHWWGETRVQAMSITVLGGLAALAMADMLWWPAAVNLYNGLRASYEFLPDLKLPNDLPFRERFLVLVALGAFFVAFHVIWAKRRTLPPPIAEDKKAGPFPEKDYAQLRDEYCSYMLRQLDQYDEDLNWSDSDYTALEAEVEANRHGSRNPRVASDLVVAIRRDHNSRSFLLLGDPGSGKSVSLRRLCRQLYGEVKSSGIVPVYVNLREWQGPVTPTDRDLADFIKTYLKRIAGRAGQRFLNRWYEPMLQHGRFFFLLDSFDEMPPVLDCDDASSKLRDISLAFDRFFHDIHQCRGVLASRRFRQPRGFRGRRLTVRPFKESQIRQSMARWLTGQPLNPGKIIRELFKDRPELAPVVRNPFLADLMTQYLIRHGGELPPSQFAIYDSYIRERLNEEEVDLRDLGVDSRQLLDAATKFAWVMYEDSGIGLEVEASRLAQLVNLGSDFDLVIQALRLVRLVRLGGANSQRLSFVHRRFAEFFVVRAIIEENREIPFEAIPEDSRWRDCVVVYCGVAPPERVQAIADFCWQVIEERGNSLNGADIQLARPVIHSMRFLRDAFAARPEFVAAFRDKLEVIVLQWVKGENILAAKLATEMLGLLGSEARSEGVRIVFGRKSSWLKETAILACRHLGSLEVTAKDAIRTHVRVTPSIELISSRKELAFSFSISDDLMGQYLKFRMDILGLEILWVSLAFLVYFSPLVVAMMLTSAIVVEIFVYLADLLTSHTGEHRNLNTEGNFGKFLRIILGMVGIRFGVPSESSGEIRGAPLWLFRSGLDTSLRIILIYSFFVTLVYGFNEGVSGVLDAEIFGLLAIAVVVFVVPFDFWVGLAGLLQKLKRGQLYRIFQFVLAGALMAVLLGVFARFGYFLIPLERWLRPLGTLLPLVSLLGIGCAAMYGFYLRVRDWYILRHIEMPQSVPRTWIHRACENLRTVQGRARLLETLRIRGTEVVGDPLPLPNEIWAKDERVLEGMARLEVRWLGLEE